MSTPHGEFFERLKVRRGNREIEGLRDQLAAATERANKLERELKQCEEDEKVLEVHCLKIRSERDALKKLLGEAGPYVEWLDRIVGHRSYIGEWLARAKEALK